MILPSQPGTTFAFLQCLRSTHQVAGPQKPEYVFGFHCVYRPPSSLFGPISSDPMRWSRPRYDGAIKAELPEHVGEDQYDGRKR